MEDANGYIMSLLQINDDNAQLDLAISSSGRMVVGGKLIQLRRSFTLNWTQEKYVFIYHNVQRVKLKSLGACLQSGVSFLSCFKGPL